MIQTNNRPKRKHEFVIIETGQHVWLDRIQTANTYFVCDSPALSLDDNYFPIEKTALREPGKQSKGISTIPKPLTAEKKTEKQELNEFFASLKVPYNCENCGKALYAFNSFAKKCCSAHILPKCDFKSIATNKDNIMFLGAGILGNCNCHDMYDSNILTRSLMKCYPLAVERYQKIKSSLTEAEIIKANIYLNLKNDVETMQEADLKNIKRHGISN